MAAAIGILILFSILIAVHLGARKLQRRRQLAALWPEEPWRWREDWSEGQSIPRENREKAFSILVGALLFTVTSVVTWLAFQKPENHRILPLYLIYIFPTVGLLMVWNGIRAFRSQQKFGPAYFVFEGACGVLGGKLQGKIPLTLRLQSLLDFKLILNCKETIAWNDSQGESRSSTRSLWQSKVHRQVDFSDLEALLPIEMDIPFDLEPTGAPTPKRRIFWELQVEFQSPQGAFKRTYEIPVFKTRESDPMKSQTNQAVQVVADFGTRGPESFKVMDTPEGMTLLFRSAARRPNWVLAFFGLIFSAIGVCFIRKLTLTSLAQESLFALIMTVLFDYFFTGVMALGFSGLGLLSLAIGLVSNLQKVSVALRAEDLRITRSLLGLRFGSTLTYEQIRSASVQAGTTMGDSIWYDIVLDCGAKLPTRISAAIPLKEEALWAVGQIQSRLKKTA